MTFTKLHGTILDSSVWSESAPTRIVWITLLAMADENGVVEASIGGLAHRARVARGECLEALHVFLSPDGDSRDGTSGERVEAVPGGWLLLNHANYRDRQTRQQAQTAARVRKWRAKRTAARNAVTEHPPISPSEAEAEAEAESYPDSAGLPVAEQKGEGVRTLDPGDPNRPTRCA